MRMPGGQGAREVPRSSQFSSTLDILPSVLDALGVAPELIAPYHGRSILREGATEGERTLVSTESPGATTPLLHDGELLAARMPNHQWCAVDGVKDPDQLKPFCTDIDTSKPDWRDRVPDSTSDPAIRPFLLRAVDRLLQHGSLNDAYWHQSRQVCSSDADPPSRADVARRRAIANPRPRIWPWRASSLPRAGRLLLSSSPFCPVTVQHVHRAWRREGFRGALVGKLLCAPTLNAVRGRCATM